MLKKVIDEANKYKRYRNANAVTKAIWIIEGCSAYCIGWVEGTVNRLMTYFKH